MPLVLWIRLILVSLWIADCWFLRIQNACTAYQYYIYKCLKIWMYVIAALYCTRSFLKGTGGPYLIGYRVSTPNPNDLLILTAPSYIIFLCLMVHKLVHKFCEYELGSIGKSIIIHSMASITPFQLTGGMIRHRRQISSLISDALFGQFGRSILNKRS